MTERRPRIVPRNPNSAPATTFARLRYVFWIVFLLLAASAPSQGATVGISEFMAINNTTLADEDKSDPDWIELYNPSTNTVDLAGWYLANSAANLAQWQFPATNIGPNGFLVVFASGKNRRVPGAPLHTNFKLGGSGEYLALVQPDGVTKASEFAPAFPQQYPDISYGYSMSGLVTTLVTTNARARVLVPSGDLGASWRREGFDDTAWPAGTLGAGYDVAGAFAPAIGTDLRTAMLNVNPSAYIRVPFTVADPTAYNVLTLRLRYQDGFAAYLNGAPVASRNAPAAPVWNSAATAAHGVPSPGALFENFEGAVTNYTLTQYDAGPGASVQPADMNSTGSFLRLLYDGTNSTANSIAFRQTAPGLFQTMVADFDFRMSSASGDPADGFSFMLIPTSLYGINGPGVNISSQPAEKPSYSGVFGVGFSVYPHTAMNDVTVHWNGAMAIDAVAPMSVIDFASGVFHHAKVTLRFVTGGARVTVGLTPNINQVPGPSYWPITNFFISGLNPFDCRVQFAARAGGLSMSMDLDNCNVQFVPPQGPPAFEDFDITASLTQLVPGTNILAIQGLTVSPGSSAFLIQPQLQVRQLTVAGSPTYLYPATPGTFNASAASLAVPSVSFWPPPGAYLSNTLTVSLASSSSSATIRYTLNGVAPGSNSPVYTGPILISNDSTFRAQALLNGLSGEIVAASYTFLDPSVTNFSSNLPVVIIDTLGKPIPDGSKIGSYARFIDTNTPSGRTRLGGPIDYAGRVGIGLHGSSSLSFPKQPYAIELEDETGHGVNSSLLGLPPGNDWLLYPPYSDKTLMNNVMSYELFEAMGHYSVRRKYVELFLHVTPGKLRYADYRGVYVLIERIRVDKDRVDLASLGPNDNQPPAVTGGYLFSKDRIDTNSLTVKTSSGQELLVLYPKPANITPAQYSYFSNYLNAFEAALYGPSWRDPLYGYAGYIDVGSFVDYHWIVEYPKNIDGSRLSNYLTKDRDGKITEGPIWDWDLAWGNANYADGAKTNGWYYPLIGDNDDLWLRKLRTDPDFYQKIIDRWGELRSGVFSVSNLFARMDALTNYLYEAQAREFACWPRLGTYVWPNPNGATGGWAVDYVNPTSYAGIIAQSKVFYAGRFAWIDSQFVPAPTLTINNATLTISAPRGSIYYTLDGTDPRLPGGGVSPSARLYTGTVSLAGNAGVLARAFSGNSWSAPARAVYAPVLPSLRITEINYHPASPPIGSPYTEDDFGFVEVQNTGTSVINLAGTRLGGGINFAFAPNQLVPAGSVTSNSFEGGGTAYWLSTLGQSPAPFVSGGPAGNLLCLLNSGIATTRNRIAFQQTAATNYDRVVAEFDFRASSSAVPVSGIPTIQDFDSAGSSYALGGSTNPVILPADSGSTGNFLRLVPAAGSEAGMIAFDRTAAGAFASIVATFDFRITPPSQQNQADGFGFALLSTATYGVTGAGPLFAEEPNLAGSIGVGFDDYNNASTPAEPNNNHISLHWNGAQIGAAAIPSFNMSNGKFHRAQVIVSFSAGTAYVTVRLTPDINGTAGPTETVFENASIAGAAPYESRVAFGARTGGQWASHDLDNVDVQFSSNSAQAAGLSFLFLPAAQFGAAGPGTTLANFTDFPLVANTLAFDLTFSPSNLFNDLTLYWNATLVESLTLPPASLKLDAGVFHHARLQLDAGNGGSYATLTITPDILGSPGTPVNIFSNLYVAGASLAGSRLEFAARNGGLATRVDLDNIVARYQVLAPMLLNAGDSVVVVRNRDAFISRYGPGIRIAGEYTGLLNHAGDRLSLLGPLGEPILDFRYDPTWYPTTDGLGFTLVAVDPAAPAANWGLAQNWRASSAPFGSPGAIDPPPRPVPPVFVNEALTHPVPPDLERVELFNPNPTNVDIGGWFLSDSFTNAEKFRIPDGTTIAPGGFAVFTATDYNPTPGLGTSFGLNAEGDHLWLFSADSTGQLTGYYHGYQFGASDEGVSFGRYVNSQGDDDFVAQVANSFGWTNAGPLVGPVVISEIMYQPPPSGGNTNAFLKYVELQNITAAPVPLFSPSQPLETWHLRDAVQFDFPTNIVLSPGQRVLVVGFDPVGDAAGLAAFRAAYPQATNVSMLGPWQGRLSNSDERIELRRPGQLTAAGTVPTVLVEAVHYRSLPPWPTAAAGQGSSLQRALLTAYGNDPTNWFAAGMSPGNANFSNQPPAVVITSPADGAVVLVPDTVRVAASATDSDGVVKTIELFVDGASLAEATNSVLSLVWTNPAPGLHRLTAGARDDSGNCTFSAPVTVTVSSPSLSIGQSAGALNLAWPSNSGTYRLSMTTNLSAASWLPVTNTPAFANGVWRVAVSPLSYNPAFYRLELLNRP